jgi:hypothetical protein
MDCINSIQKLSANKLTEAKCLFENGFIDWSYYTLQRAARDASFKAKWSTVCSWDEGSRYISGRKKAEVQNFLISIKDIAKWIQKYL